MSSIPEGNLTPDQVKILSVRPLTRAYLRQRNPDESFSDWFAQLDFHAERQERLMKLAIGDEGLEAINLNSLNILSAQGLVLKKEDESVLLRPVRRWLCMGFELEKPENVELMKEAIARKAYVGEVFFIYGLPKEEIIKAYQGVYGILTSGRSLRSYQRVTDNLRVFRDFVNELPE